MTEYDVATVKALEWYAVQGENCRKVTPEGREACNNIDKDGGKRARAALHALPIALPAPLTAGDVIDAARYRKLRGQSVTIPVIGYQTTEARAFKSLDDYVDGLFSPAERATLTTTAPPAPVVSADDVALIDGMEAHLNSEVARYRNADTVLFVTAPNFRRLLALARRAAPAVDHAELDRLREALDDCVAILSGELAGKSQVEGVIREARAALNREGNVG